MKLHPWTMMAIAMLVAILFTAAACVPVAAPSPAPPPAGPTTAPATASSAAAAQVKANKNYTIGSLVWNTSVPFYSNFIKGQQDTAKATGVTLDLQNGNGDLATQVAVIQQFIAKKVDLIIVTPSDAQGIVPVIKQANQAGIPVIAANNRVGEGPDVVTFVGADDKEFGKMQGQLLVKAIGNKGNVALILGALGTSAQILRQQGMTEFLKDYPDIKIVAQQTADWDNAKALSVAQDLLNKYPKGQLDAIIDQGPEGANAAKYAFDNGRTDVKFLMGDYPADVRKGIQAGYIYGTVDQDPLPQGVEAVQLGVLWLNGQKDKVPAPNHYLPLPIVTKENVEQYPAAWGGS
ncbi:MAG: sugar ABC transporter substrate-binding protein [Rudaea sp.]